MCQSDSQNDLIRIDEKEIMKESTNQRDISIPRLGSVSEEQTDLAVNEEKTEKKRNPISLFMIILIKGYQNFISPMFPAHCRFYPTCSAYFIQALEKYGFFKGSYLGIKRILRCHPFNPGGYDPLK